MPRVRLRKPILPIVIALLLGLTVAGLPRAVAVAFIGIGSLFALAYYWANSLSTGLQLRRETRLRWAVVGGQIEERLTLSNFALLPATYIEFRDQSTLPGFNANHVLNIGERSFEQWTVRAVCGQRGVFSLGGAEAFTGDPFGIFDVTVRFDEKTKILVLPQASAAPNLSISASGLSQENRAFRNNSSQTAHASSVREYVTGDSIRMMHWLTTARLNKPFVRLTDAVPGGDWHILLDLNHGQCLGTGWDSIEEQSVALAVSLAERGLREKKSVGLTINGSALIQLPVKKGSSQQWEILYALAGANPGKLDLDSLFERANPALEKNISLLILTASNDLSWIKHLTMLRKRNAAATVFYFNPHEYSGPDIVGALSRLADLEIKYHVVPRGLMQRPTDTPHEEGGGWTMLPTGEAMPVWKGKATR